MLKEVTQNILTDFQNHEFSQMQLDSITYLYHKMEDSPLQSIDLLKESLFKFAPGEAYSKIRLESLSQTLIKLKSHGLLEQHFEPILNGLDLMIKNSISESKIHDFFLLVRRLTSIPVIREHYLLKIIKFLSSEYVLSRPNIFEQSCKSISGTTSLFLTSTAKRENKDRTRIFKALFDFSFHNTRDIEINIYALNQATNLRRTLESNYFNYERSQKKFLIEDLAPMLEEATKIAKNESLDSAKRTISTARLVLSDKEKLLKDKNFCILPYIGSCIEAGGRYKPCCKYKVWDDKIDANDVSLKELVNSDFTDKIKNSQAEGQIDPGCLRCIKDEETGLSSMRQSYNRCHADIFEMRDIIDSKVKIIDFGFGNQCNAACITCESISSSLWIKDDQYLSDYKDNVFDRFPRPLAVNDFGNWQDADYENLRCIAHAQNEVLNNKRFEHFIDSVIEKGRASKCRLEISTNGGYEIKQELVDKILSFDEIEIQLSIDSVGEKNSYIRYPLQWDFIEKSTRFWSELTKRNEHLSLRCRCTVSLYNILDINEILNWWDETTGRQNCIRILPMQFGYVLSPTYLSPYNLPDNLKKEIAQKSKSEFVQKLLTRSANNDELQKFFEFTQILDKRRGLNFKQTFPELYLKTTEYDMNNPNNEIQKIANFWQSYRNQSIEKSIPDISDDYRSIKFKSNLPHLKLNIPFDVDYNKMLDEAKALKELFVDHRSGGKHKGWKSLCLHGLSATQTQAAEHYGDYSEEDAPYQWTEIKDKCPYTYNFFKNVFPYKKYRRLRFMLLESNGYILPHSDSEDSQLGPLNIALNQPEGCEMVFMEHGLIPIEPSSFNWIDISNTHSVWNNSPEDRYHIIIHGTPDESAYPIFERSFIDYKRELSDKLKNASLYRIYDWKKFHYLEKDLRFYSLYYLGYSFGPQDVHNFYESLENTQDPYSIIDDVVSKIDIVNNIADCEFFLKKVRPGDEWLIDDHTNMVSVLIAKEPGKLNYYRHIDYDGGEFRPDDIYDHDYQIAPGEFVVVNPKGDTTLKNRTKSNLYLLQFCADELVLSSEYSIEKLITGKHNPTSQEIYTAVNIERAKKGFSFRPSLINAWQEFGFTVTEDILNEFIFVVIEDQFDDPKFNKELLEKHTLASLYPLPNHVVKKDSIEDFLSQRSEKIAIVLNSGSAVHDFSEFVYECIACGSKLRRSQNLVMGHIMDWSSADQRGDKRLPYLHEQFLILNIEVWKKLGSPNLNPSTTRESSSFSFPQYKASEEKIHSEYTPLYLHPNEGEGKPGNERWGTSLLASSIANGISASNIPFTLRSTKTYAYPNSDDREDLYRQEHRIEDFLTQAQAKVFTVNINKFRYNPPQGFAPDTFISVASAWNPAQFAFHHRNSLSNVTLIDHSHRSLNYWKELTRNPTQENLLKRMQFASYRADEEVDHKRVHTFTYEQNYKQVLKDLDLNHVQFMQFIHDLPTSFIPTDFIQDELSISRLINPTGTSLVWISNAFYSNCSFYLYFKDELRQKFRNMLLACAKVLGDEAFLIEGTYSSGYVGNPKSPKLIILDDYQLNWSSTEHVISRSLKIE